MASYSSQKALLKAHDRLVQLCKARAFVEAVALAEKLTAAHPNQPALWLILGCAQAELGALEAAEAALQRSLDLAPDQPSTRYNCGLVLQRNGKFSDAAAQYKAALRLAPEHAEALNNLGVVLAELGDDQQAINTLETALGNDPNYHDARVNLAAIYERQRRHDPALAEVEKVLTLCPDHQPALALVLRLKRRCCDFGADALFAGVKSGLGVDGTPLPPFDALALEDAPARQLQRAKAWVAEKFGHIKPAHIPAKARPKLRIGYFSANFRQHPNMVLTAGLYRSHDRARFDILAFSTGLQGQDEQTEYVKAKTTAFVDLASQSDARAAVQARDRGLDVAIDLDGHTRGARLGIFAHRVAAVQVSYLGFPGSSGASFIDYLVADQVVIPAEMRPHYAEAVLYMPASYQANDDLRSFQVADDCRADHGLPQDAVVMCCFNASYKIGRAEFDAWMRVLRAVKDAVLWLYRSNDQMIARLRAAAKAQGVDPARLIFAGRLPHAEHLARHRHADLVIDTFNYNAHTTASDALWAGVPVVSLAGQQFAARVGASLLRASGLSELIVETREAYEALIIDLASDRARCAAMKTRVARARRSAALFDTRAFTASFEEALWAAHQRKLAGLAPTDIHAPAFPREDR